MADPVIKIHENFTISDGISSSAFTTGDADYTPTTFAAKLTNDLAGNTVTFDDTSGSGYLEFANAATLTGMPNYIFTIPSSDFYVKAGGRVDFSNVNLDAQMTIGVIYEAQLPFGQVGDMIVGENAGDEAASDVAMSADGTIVAVGEHKYDDKGRAAVYKYSGGLWVKMGAYIDGTVVGGFFGKGIALSADGSIVAIGAEASSDSIGLVRMFQYSTPGIIGGSWTPIGENIDGNVVSHGATQRFGGAVALSDNGSIVAIGDWGGYYIVVYQYKIPTTTEWTSGNVIKGTDTTQVVDKFYWTLLGANMNPGVGGRFGQKISLNANGNIVAAGGEWVSGDAGRVIAYQYNGGSWSQLGSQIHADKRTQTPSLSDDGNIIAVGAAGFNATGMTKVYQYSTPGEIGGSWNQLGNDMAGGVGTSYMQKVAINGDGTILVASGPGQTANNNSVGFANIWQYNGSSWIKVESISGSATSKLGNTVSISRDGSIFILGAPGYDVTGTDSQGAAFVYRLPGTGIVSNSSTIPAGDSFINNFVSTIETDLDLPLSYDADNALITFDGLAQDISMSITSTDTSVFDMFITEITVADNTLPFITYGQPDPTLANYIENGMTMTELLASYTVAQLVAGGITAAQLFAENISLVDIIAGGGVPDWNMDSGANRLVQSYVKDFIDISGSLILHGNANLTVTGNIETKGNIIVNYPTLDADLSFNHRIFVGEDVSMNGNVTVGDVSVKGKVVNCSFPNSSIPESTFVGTILTPPDYTQPTIMYEKGFDTTADVSMNANVQLNNLKVDGNIAFSDGTTMNTYDDNKESSGTTFKASTFTSLTISNTLTAGSFSTSSDYRIKTDVSQLDETITLDNLRPVKYLQTLINKPQYGLIAHELQEYYPDLVVGEKDGDELQRVNYTGLVALLIHEIKQLKQELTELENEVQ